MWITRKSARGVLLGIAAVVGCALVAGLAQASAAQLAYNHDLKIAEEYCSKGEPIVSWERCSYHLSNFPDQKQRLLEKGCDAGAIDACVALDEHLNGTQLLPANARPPSAPLERARKLCAELPEGAERLHCHIFDDPSSGLAF